jgi:peptidoglycan/xylan/chitin deacetylase (PgdA/CDA1 family)
MGVSRRSFLAGVPVVLAAGTAGGVLTWGTERAEASTTRAPTPPTSIAPGEVRGQLRTSWSGSPSSGAVALTFDDGPTVQFTAQVLAVLSRYDVRATFFMIGALVERHPDLVRQVRDGGHELANHSYDHRSAAVSQGWQVHDSMLRGVETLETATGVRPRWYRPPRGEVTSATLLAALAGEQDLALWSVGRGTRVADTDSRGIVDHLVGSTAAGDVVDLHDGIGRSSFVGRPAPPLIARGRAEVVALPDALERWLADGLRVTTLSDLIP